MRKTATAAALALLAVTGLASIAGAIAPLPSRQDVIWARSTMGAPIVLDGVLDEPGWASAETMTLTYRGNYAVPGSGWKDEGGLVATDSTFATIKFLSNGNNIYMGITVRDSSVGGSADFNRFDGLLMAVKDRSARCGRGHRQSTSTPGGPRAIPIRPPPATSRASSAAGATSHPRRPVRRSRSTRGTR